MTLNSIRTKIIGGYILFVVLSLSFLGLNYGLVNSTVNKTDRIYRDSEWARSEMETENIFWRQVIAMSDYFLTGAEEHNTKVHEYQQIVVAQLAALEASVPSTEERAAVRQLKSRYELVGTKFEKAAALYRASQVAEAKRVALAEIDPAVAQMEEAWEQFLALKRAEIDMAIKQIRANKRYAWMLPALTPMIENTEAIYAEDQALLHMLDAEENFLKQVVALTNLLVFNERAHLDEFDKFGQGFHEELSSEKSFTETGDESDLLNLIKAKHIAFSNAFYEMARFYKSGERARALRAEMDKVDPAEDELAQALKQFYPLKQQDMKGRLANVLLVDETALSITKNLGIWVFLTLIIGLIVGALSAIRITRPVRQLAEATQRIAAGDFSARLGVKSKDEIGQLSRSFNSMVETLQGTTVSKDYVDGILCSMSNSLVVASADGRIVTVNTATCRMLGYMEAELKGWPLAMLFAPDDEPESTDLDDADTAGDVERIYLAKDGRRIPISSSRTALWLDSSQTQGTVCLAKDITEQKRAEAERQVISDIVKGVITTTNLDELLNLARHAIGKLLYAENCFVALHDEATDMLHFEFWADKVDPVPPPRPVGQGFSSYVLRTGQSLLLTEEIKITCTSRAKFR
ncbi:MAG: HAMP domain-containing protein [Pyrinomonadaceae bacterium]